MGRRIGWVSDERKGRWVVEQISEWAGNGLMDGWTVG